MTAEQQAALDHLGRLTETGRIGQDPSSQCVYRVRGTENGIQLFQMGVTNADMRRFALLPDWGWVTLRECPVGDAGLKHLSGQKRLKFLDIGETHVTTLHPIRDCLRLRVLKCDMLESLTDRKATALAGFRELEHLDLAWTKIGNETVARLAGCSELRKLVLTGTQVTDEGLRVIGALPKLEMLGLYYTGVTDEGLRHLPSAPELRLLVVGHTKVTKKGRAALRRVAPALKVVDYEGIY